MKSKVEMWQIVVIFLFAWIYAATGQAADDQLKLGVSMYDRTTGTYLNEQLEAGDHVRTPFRKFRIFNYLTNPEIDRAMSIPSHYIASDYLQSLKSAGIDIVAYDIEPGLKNITDEELSDPVGAVRTMSTFCEQNDFRLIVGPSRKILKRHGAEMAQYADAIGIMSGKSQERSAVDFKADMLELINIVKYGNSDVQIYIQLRTFHKSRSSTQDDYFSATELMRFVNEVRDHADGISLIYTRDTIPIMEEFIYKFKLNR
ncbi:hypothetical protein ACFLU6_11350 [Acidobacteriota bacterium]